MEESQNSQRKHQAVLHYSKWLYEAVFFTANKGKCECRKWMKEHLGSEEYIKAI